MIPVSAAIDAARRAGETLRGASSRLGSVGACASVVGEAGPGRLGELGQRFTALWARAVDARTTEATAHAARLDELADALERAAAGYANTDDAAHRRGAEAQ